MRALRNFKANRCYYLISRITNRVFFLSVVIAVGVAWVSFNVTDDFGAVDDSDLAAKPPPALPADENNAYYWYLLAATNKVTSVIDYSKVQVWLNNERSTNLNSHIEMALATNAVFLAAVEKGLACEKYVAKSQIPFERSTPFTMTLLFASRLYNFKAIMARREGDFYAALKHVEKILRIEEQTLAYVWGNTEVLIARVIGGIGRKNLYDIASSKDCPDEIIKRIACMEVQHEASFQKYIDAMNADYSMLKKMLADEKDDQNGWDKILSPYFLHENKTIALATDIIRWKKQVLRGSYVNAPSLPNKVEEFCKSSISWDLWLHRFLAKDKPFLGFAPNSAGKRLIECFCGISKDRHPMIDMAIFFKEESFAALYSASIACIKFNRKFGRYPSCLDELVPSYLREVPRDPYDGEPIRYDTNERKLWSKMFVIEEQKEKRMGKKYVDKRKKLYERVLP